MLNPPEQEAPSSTPHTTPSSYPSDTSLPQRLDLMCSCRPLLRNKPPEDLLANSNSRSS